jgi:dihydroorotate dehydrogenase
MKNILIEHLVIGAPFGNYLHWPGITSTLGTYTLQDRGGAFYRFWRVLKTVRPLPRGGGWVNQLGLPNPGIASLGDRILPREILSIHGFSLDDWVRLIVYGTGLGAMALELNVSCPNVHTIAVGDCVKACTICSMGRASPLIVKLPPVHWMEHAQPFYDIGVRCFHCCNTIPTSRGGFSGKVLKPYSLWAIADLRDRWGDEVQIIGGGGVTSCDDVADYQHAGADHVAIASALLNPLTWRQVSRWRDSLTGD